MENIGFAEKYIAAFLKERLLKLSELKKKKPIELCGGSCQQNYFCSFFFDSLVTSFLKKITNI